MSGTGIARLEPNGPAGAGLIGLELSPEDFQSDLPEQNWHVYHEDTELGLTVGVWTTTSMQEAFGPYPGDEFMYLLEGNVIMLDGKGNETNIGEGETFFVRNGIPVSWKQDGFCRKFFMTFLSPDGETPKIETVKGGINILREEELENRFKEEPGEPLQRDAVCSENDVGNMTAGMWESEPFESAMAPFPSHELAQLLSGKVTITDEVGMVHSFSAGDVFFIAQGTVCSWKAEVPVRKFYCSLVSA